MHPLRSHHRREALGEVAQHLEGGRARTDDDGSAEFHGWNSGAAKDLAYAESRGEMGGERWLVPLLVRGIERGESTEVDNAGDVGCQGGVRERLRHRGLKIVEPVSLNERVEQVVRDIDILHRE